MFEKLYITSWGYILVELLVEVSRQPELYPMRRILYVRALLYPALSWDFHQNYLWYFCYTTQAFCWFSYFLTHNKIASLTSVAVWKKWIWDKNHIKTPKPRNRSLRQENDFKVKLLTLNRAVCVKMLIKFRIIFLNP